MSASAVCLKFVAPRCSTVEKAMKEGYGREGKVVSVCCDWDSINNKVVNTRWG